MQRRSILPYRIIELEISDDESFARNDLEISQKSKFFRDLELAKFYPKESDEGEEEEEEEEPENDVSYKPVAASCIHLDAKTDFS